MPLENNMIIRKVKRNIFFILVALTTFAFFWLIGPFILTVFWGAVLAVIFFPVYRRIRITFRGRDALAGAITTLLVVLFVIVPFTLLAIALVNQAISLYENVQTGDMNTTVILDYIDTQLPSVSDALSDFGVSTADLRTRLNTTVAQVSQFLATWAIGFGGSILNIIIQFTLVIYLLYFFLVDGWNIQRTLVRTIPMGDNRERALFERFALVARATLKGTLIVAFVQGAIGGIMFAILGIPAALLWGVFMMLLALLPVGGSAIVWVPAAIIMFIQGNIASGIIIVVVGSLIIGLVDNLLRPLLVGRDTHMPDWVVLISTLGGIAMFGLTGFVIGPTLAALFITVWSMLGQDYGGNQP
ncbi:putative PurR-regulated permease PerM [Neolewinella xylanilytica]|uniref:Putative PurR-regulated permease PerM n=1 Tax=Neolewinella xylanilytica TaxID=1514080 RepID=A0A2S6I5K7_9BACT|nr:AI-2E family transporter [Neolewinella xylanilytica]PPK86453.1 putative PurR-regulated permease PerM [Neolewinella xylanilytica]